MQRLKALDLQEASSEARRLLEGVQATLGMTPNIMRAMASSPAVLDAYLSFSRALGRGSLRVQLREQIALTVAELNGCNYCLAAHSAIARAAGLSEEEILDSRRGTSPERKADAVLRLARQIVEKRGWVTDEEIARARRAGLGDGEIAEVVANVAASIFTNYFNHVAGTEVDFPAVPKLESA